MLTTPDRLSLHKATAAKFGNRQDTGIYKLANTNRTDSKEHRRNRLADITPLWKWYAFHRDNDSFKSRSPAPPLRGGARERRVSDNPSSSVSPGRFASTNEYNTPCGAPLSQ